MERVRQRERHETVKTQKQYYLHNMRSAYFPINRRLHRERDREQEREREMERERDTERERCEIVQTQKQYYLHNM